MIKHQRFSPDTCQCVFMETLDDALPPDQLIISLELVEHRCAFHAWIMDDSIYGIVKEENRRKNRALDICAVQIAEVAANRGLAAWAYTAGRTLQLSFPSVQVANAVKQIIQTACDTNLGLGLVVVS